jgi:hypothetical protein
MGKIQSYRPQTTQGPWRGPWISAGNVKGAFGGGTMDAIQDMGAKVEQGNDKLFQQQMEIKDRQDKSIAKDAFIAFGDGVRTLETDFFSRKKRDSKGASLEADKRVGELLTKTSGSLENDEQREMFEAIAATRRSSFLNSVAGHELKELEIWEKETSDSTITEASQVVIDNPTDENVSNAKIAIDLAVETGMRGSDAETKRSFKEMKISSMHAGAIEAKAVDDATAAREYYERYKYDIDAPMRTKIEKTLKSLGEKQRAQRESVRIYNPAKSLTEMRKAVDKLPSSVQDQTMAYIKERHNLYTLDIKNRQARANAKAWQQILDNPVLDSIPDDMEPKEEKSAREYIKKIQKAQANGQNDIETDWGLYYEFKNMPHKDFKKVNLMAARDRLATPQLKDLINLQTKEQKEGKPDRVRSILAQANNALEAIGFEEKKKNEKRSALRNDFFRKLDEELGRYDSKELTSEKTQEIIDALLIKTKDSFWDSNDRYLFQEDATWSEEHGGWVVKRGDKLLKWVDD